MYKADTEPSVMHSRMKKMKYVLALNFDGSGKEIINVMQLNTKRDNQNIWIVLQYDKP